MHLSTQLPKLRIMQKLLNHLLCEENEINMISYHKKWAILYMIYKETNRAGLVKSLYRNKPFSQSWLYKITFVFYCILSVGVFYLSSKNPATLLLVVPLIFCIYAWLDLVIYWEYKEQYQKHDLRSYPFFQRTKNLSYVLFSDKLLVNDFIKNEEIESLVEWQRSKSAKFTSLSFFNTPIILILLTALSSLFLEYLKSQNLVVTKYILPIVVCIFLVIWFCWGIFDALKGDYKINLEICRYLKCFKIENNIT